MRIRRVTLFTGLLLAASSGGLLLFASIGIIAGLAQFWTPGPCSGHCPYVPPEHINQLADFWALLGFCSIFASIGGLAGLLFGRKIARLLALGAISLLTLVSITSWWAVLSQFTRFNYYSIPGIYIMLPFASLFLGISSAIAMTVFII